MHNRIACAALVAAAALVCPAFATVNSTSNTVTYTGNGATTSFTVPFKFLASSDLVVTVGGVSKALGTDYTVTGAGNATGTVKFTVAPANTAAVVITRAVPLTQGTSLRSTLPPPIGTVIETALDRATMQAQDTRAMQAIRDVGQDTTFAANLAAAVATQATRDSTQDAALTAFITTQSARDAAQNLALAQGAIGGSSTMVVPTGTSFGRTLADTFADNISVKSFTGVTGNGLTDDSAGVLAACNATTTRRLYFPAGTYRISVNTVCNSATVWMEAGAQFSIDAGKFLTISGRMISFGGDPAVGSGGIVYSKDTNYFANDNGFSFSKTPSVGGDDFFHIRRDVNNNTGIIIRNDDPGALVDSYIHLYGGPLIGGTQGSGLRMDAKSQAGGSLVNIVAENDLAFSLINQAAAPLDLYTANVRQFQIASVASAVNYWQFKGSPTTSSISVAPAGTDTNVSIVNNTKGNGSHFFRTGATPAFQAEIFDTAGATNRLRLTGGTNPTITTSGGNLTLASVGGSVTTPTLVIGPSGTAISNSIRATGTVTPGTILTGASANMSLTVTGAVAGADCVVTPPAGGTGALSLSCWVTTNTCNFSLGNASAGSLTGPSGTWACRVTNP